MRCMKKQLISKLILYKTNGIQILKFVTFMQFNIIVFRERVKKSNNCHIICIYTITDSKIAYVFVANIMQTVTLGRTSHHTKQLSHFFRKFYYQKVDNSSIYFINPIHTFIYIYI